MRHEMLTQRALFCHRANTKRGTPSQHFVTHVVPPLVFSTLTLTCDMPHEDTEIWGLGGGGSGSSVEPPNDLH